MIDPIEGEVVDPDNPPIYGWRDAPVSGERVDLHEGPIIAGDPAGARVEVTETGLRAYDGTGTETASIAGEGGEFVGGSFRTSDALPGQVTLSDTGYTHSGTGVSRPGIRIDPEDSSGLAAAAGIGPIGGGFEIDGGRSTSGERTSITMRPGYSLIRADGALAGTGTSDISVQPSQAQVEARNGAHRGSVRTVPGGVILSATHPDGADAAQAAADTLGARLRAYRTDGSRAGSVEATDTTATVSVRDAAGTTRGSMEVSETGATSRSFSGNSSESGWVRARPQDAELAYVDANNTYSSRIKADASEAFIYTRAGGTSRYLTVDANGVWVRAGSESYNLEQLAKDTGRNEFPTVAGVTRPVPPTWRNKSEMILFHGTVNKDWVVGWNSVAIGMPLVTRPDIEEVRNAPIPEPGYLIRITPGGALDVYAPTAGARDVRLSGLIYPLG